METSLEWRASRICTRAYFIFDIHKYAFKLWVASSKPRQGEVFDSMRFSRANFKYLLRKCRREEATVGTLCPLGDAGG